LADFSQSYDRLCMYFSQHSVDILWVSYHITYLVFFSIIILKLFSVKLSPIFIRNGYPAPGTKWCLYLSILHYLYIEHKRNILYLLTSVSQNFNSGFCSWIFYAVILRFKYNISNFWFCQEQYEDNLHSLSHLVHQDV